MMANRFIYLDNHATTPMDPRVLKSMLPWMGSSFGNAHSRDHALGDQSARAVEAARAEVAALVGAAPDNIIFTSGATESANIAIEGFCLKMKQMGRKVRMALPPTEHLAALETCHEMARRNLAEINWIAVDSLGRVDVAQIETLCRDGINFICIMGANNEIGNIYPVDVIGKISAEYGAAVFCDGSQAIGKIPFDFDKSHVDYLAVSGHKIYGPKGIGSLVIRHTNSVCPTRFGGGHEQNVRPGTLNVPGIVGLGVACRLRQEEMGKDEARIQTMRNRMQMLLSERVSSLKVNGDSISRLAGNLHVAVGGVPNDAVIAQVRDRLAISTGSACSSGSDAPSHVLRGIGLADEWIHGALRIGIGKFNDEQDIEESADALCKAIERVRKMCVTA